MESLKLDAAKLEAGGLGRRTEVDLDMPIDIGVFTMRSDDDFTSDAVLHSEKHLVTSYENTIEFTVNQRPTAVGIDPYRKLLDWKSEDNFKSL